MMTRTIPDTSRTPGSMFGNKARKKLRVCPWHYCMVLTIGISVMNFLLLTSSGLSQYNDAIHTTAWSPITLNSSNKNKLGSLTSEEIAPLQDLQQAEPESKSLRDNETTQVLKFVSGEGEAPSTAMQTASTMTIHDAFLQY